LAFVLLTGLTVAWQNPPPLSLTAAVDPAMAASGQMVTVTLTIANPGDSALEDVEITATVPQGTDFERAAADNQQWDIELSQGIVRYRATGPLPAGQRAQVTLVVAVLPAAGPSIVFDTYEATAKGLAQPVKGEPVSINVAATPTPRVTQTPTTAATNTRPAATPTTAATSTRPAATPTPTAVATATPEPSPSATATPEPTPTITVVAAELPPTPTPNLSTEQEVIGTVTVLIFVVIVVAIIIAAVVWIVRTARSG
jgi:uncharacterized repeat protein (TIGR01451 family)